VFSDFNEHGRPMKLPTFYIGTDNPAWLKRYEGPLFVSRRRLQRYKTLPVAVGRWACDSGGFTEIHKYGEWRLTSKEYAGMVTRYADEIGNLDWAAPQDWMCEPSAVEATGLTPAIHQKNTVANFLDLRQRLGSIIVPVLQGWEHDDYLRCVAMYEKAGVDLTKEATIGLGSVCRRSADDEISAIIASLYPLRLHGFGMKSAAFVRNADRLVSADSLAWTWKARRGIGLPECNGKHKCCKNCYPFAVKWRDSFLAKANQPQLFSPTGKGQR
jgi:hypothetical protein